MFSCSGDTIKSQKWIKDGNMVIMKKDYQYNMVNCIYKLTVWNGTSTYIYKTNEFTYDKYHEGDTISNVIIH